jgi:hypothetical protein
LPEAQVRPGIMEKTTQLHAVKLAAIPATKAKMKPKPDPFSS